MAIVQLDPAASRDIRKLFRDQQTLTRLRQALRDLEADTPNLDIKTLSGRSPWFRLRVGDWRILFRPFSRDEARKLGAGGYLVARIVNRRDLERAARNL
jgi:mRNA-degrading endonuclease RelE of RelBE toxin-antitoxin system